MIFTPLQAIHAVCTDCRRYHCDLQAEPQHVEGYWLDWQAKHPGHRTGVVTTERLLQITGKAVWNPNADIKRAYAASSALTQTALDAVASSSTHVAGWESDEIVNTSNLYEDYRITAVLQVESAGIAAGEIRLHLVGRLNDSAWPDVFDGTQSAETVTDINVAAAICHLAAFTATDTTASQLYYLDCPSAAAVFAGNLPAGFVVFITQSTGAALESTGDPNQVYVKGSYHTV